MKTIDLICYTNSAVASLVIDSSDRSGASGYWRGTGFNWAYLICAMGSIYCTMMHSIKIMSNNKITERFLALNLDRTIIRGTLPWHF